MKKKENFYKRLMEAFSNNEIFFFAANVTDDIEWTVIGDFKGKGKKAFIDTMKKWQVMNLFYWRSKI